MPKVTWVLGNGKEISAAVPVGHNLMEAAVANNVPNVIGECGGCLSCATCHVYVDPSWYGKTGGPDDMEGDMLEITMAERKDTSARFHARVAEALAELERVARELLLSEQHVAPEAKIDAVELPVLLSFHAAKTRVASEFRLAEAEISARPRAS